MMKWKLKFSAENNSREGEKNGLYLPWDDGALVAIEPELNPGNSFSLRLGLHFHGATGNEKMLSPISRRQGFWREIGAPPLLPNPLLTIDNRDCPLHVGQWSDRFSRGLSALAVGNHRFPSCSWSGSSSWCIFPPSFFLSFLLQWHFSGRNWKKVMWEVVRLLAVLSLSR